MTDDIHVALDQEWGRAGDELEWGAELLIEWGVKFSGGGLHTFYSLYGSDDDSEGEARKFVENYAGDCAVEVVARRVLYGPWGERS